MPTDSPRGPEDFFGDEWPAIRLGYQHLTWREDQVLATWSEHPDYSYREMLALLPNSNGSDKPITLSTLKAHIDHISRKLYTHGAQATIERYRWLRAYFGPRP